MCHTIYHFDLPVYHNNEKSIKRRLVITKGMIPNIYHLFSFDKNECTFYSFIHFLPLYPVKGRGGPGAYPSVIGRGRVHPGQVASSSQG